MSSCTVAFLTIFPSSAKWYVFSFAQTVTTRILFSVSVPVLSVAITVVLPSASIAPSFLKIAFCFAILCKPTASVMVMTAGRPSGTAATNKLMLVKSISTNSRCCRRPTTNKVAVIIRAATLTCIPRRVILWVSGESALSMSDRDFAKLPKFVLDPVFVISTVARPAETIVPIKTRFESLAFSDLETGSDSPVSAASLTSKRSDPRIFASAGILSPSPR